MRAALEAGLAQAGQTLTGEQIDRLCRFGALLLEKNQVMNLTAITEPSAVAQLHFLDSLTVLRAADCRGKSIIDVGCGAGFPGVPVAIAEPTAKLTLLDSLQKRMNWLQNEALPALEIPVRFLTGRAEDFAAANRGHFDVVASRAVARLNLLCELCLPYVHTGGYFLAMKGAETDTELKEARRAIQLLGGAYERTERFSIGGAEHRVIVIHKTAPTPEQYPRPFARMKQKPL